VGELSLCVGMHLDAPSTSCAVNDVDGVAMAGADLVEHGLARYPKQPSGLIELDVAGRRLWGEMSCRASPSVAGQGRILIKRREVRL
jgi:hypothetical protein